MRIFTLAVMVFCFSLTGFAQEEETAPVAEETAVKKPKKDPFESYQRRHAIALNFGAIGGGLEYAHNLNRHFNVRGRFTYFNLNDIELSIELSGEEMTGKIGSDIFIADALVEYLPFKRAGLKLVGGISYLINYEARLSAQYNGELSYGDLTITSEDIGRMDAAVDWSGFAPYLGLGYGRAVPKRRFGFGLELGTHYAQSPKIDLRATGSISETANQKDQLEEDLQGYRWLPFAQFRLTYKL